MKNLLFLAVVFPCTLIAQTLVGVNAEDLIQYYPGLMKNESGLNVKKISLKTGVTLEYVEKGDINGTPVIFLHGLSDSWHSFESALLQMPTEIHAFAISQRGHGDSERPATGYTPKEFAADVAAFVEQLGIGPVIIAGHSMGGVMAQQFALDYPKLLKAMVILGSDPDFRNNPGMPEFYEYALQMEGKIEHDFMVEFQKGTLAKPIDSAYFNLLVEELLKVPVYVFQAALKGLMEVNYKEVLPKINQPVLVLWGDKDSFCTREGQEVFKSGFKNVRLVEFTGNGHALHWEDPARFVRELVQFIKDLKKEAK